MSPHPNDPKPESAADTVQTGASPDLRGDAKAKSAVAAEPTAPTGDFDDDCGDGKGGGSS